jgi:hypothetical protein
MNITIFEKESQCLVCHENDFSVFSVYSVGSIFIAGRKGKMRLNNPGNNTKIPKNNFGNDTKKLKNSFGNVTIPLCLTGIF